MRERLLVFAAAITALTFGGMPVLGDCPAVMTTVVNTHLNHPYAVAAGDVDGDGDADLAVVAANGSGTFVIGSGDGTFLMTLSGEGCPAARRVLTGNFDGDARADVVLACDDRVSVIFGDGGGSTSYGNFGESRGFTAATADFNADGSPDIAVASMVNNNVWLFIGGGASGPMPAPQTSFYVPDPVAVTAGDFDGDGKTDLAVASQWGTISILLGNGNGTFDPRVEYPAGDVLTAIASADFDRDGFADVAVTAITGTSSSVSILTSGGDAVLGSPVPYAVGSEPSDVVVADFSGDGKPDLAVASRVADQVSILIGNGDGTFAPAVPFPVGNSPESLAVADFDRDGRIDLAVGTRYLDDVSLLLNRCVSAVLDVDGNGSAGALTDGLLLLRYLFGFSGPSLTNGAVGSGANRATAAQIEAHFAARLATLDVDGDGSAAPLTDGLLVLRYLFGFRGTPLIANAVAPGATRTTAAQIEAYLGGI